MSKSCQKEMDTLDYIFGQLDRGMTEMNRDIDEVVYITKEVVRRFEMNPENVNINTSDVKSLEDQVAKLTKKNEELEVEKERSRQLNNLNDKIAEVKIASLQKKLALKKQPICEKCQRIFSGTVEDRVPKVLHGCGHTICLGCALRIEATEIPKVIQCPFDKCPTKLDEMGVWGLSPNLSLIQLFSL